jgi:hypothetical protein
MSNSIVLSLNSCQKVCLAVNNSTCPSNASYTWASSNPSLVTLTTSTIGCIVSVNSIMLSGIVYITALDVTSSVVFTAVITVNSYTTSSFSPTTTQFIYSEIVNNTPASVNIPFSITGPIGGLAGGNLSNIVFFATNMLPFATGNMSASITNTLFTPGTNSFLYCYTLNQSCTATEAPCSGAITNFAIGISMFRTISSSFNDPLFTSVFAKTLPIPGIGVTTLTVTFPNKLNCSYTNYVVYMQLNTAADFAFSPFGCILNSDNQTATLQLGTLIQYLGGYPTPNLYTTVGVSTMICPNGYLNASSSSLVYSAILTSISIPNGVNTVTITLPVTLPYNASAPLICYCINNSLGLATAALGNLQLSFVQQASATTVNLGCINNTGSTLTTSLNFIAIAPPTTSTKILHFQ